MISSFDVQPGQPFDLVELGVVDPAFTNPTGTTFVQIEALGAIPVGTRKIRVRLDIDQVSGATPNLAIDDVTLEIDPGKWFTITNERPFPMMGDILNKVGRTSGWTRGPVTATCFDTGVSGSAPPIAMLCQDRVQAYVAGGDSGSPVFEQIGGWNPVTLVGILWGGSASSFVFSAMENIHAEFGEFRVR